MASLLLYSTVPFMKWLIQHRYRGDRHYVWCSESFDSSTLPRYSIGHYVGPTSDPATIYKEMKEAVARTDTHYWKINEQIASLTKLAIDWEAAKEISPADRDDILYMIKEQSFFQYWRPVLYVIPRVLVDARLKPVPMAKCASLGPEFILEDLAANEFDRIEF